MSYIAPSIIASDQWPTGDKIYLAALPAWTQGWLLSPVLVNGSRTFNPSVEIPEALGGIVVGGPNTTFYNRIVIEPSEIDLGNLLSSQTRQVMVWNGFLVDAELESVTGTNTTGLTLTQPETPPYTMHPLELLTYDLNISTEGPPVIDAAYTWTVDGEDYLLTVIGRRVVIWSLGPDWSDPISEELGWKTDILTAYAGNEQRRGLRNRARRRFEYGFKAFGLDAQRMDNLLWGWQNRVYAMPVWPDQSALTAEIPAGAVSIPVVTTQFSFAVNSLALIYFSSTESEAIEIQSLTSSTIIPKLPTTRPWPKGTLVFPMVLGHLPTSVPMQRLTDTVVRGNIMLETSPDVVDPFIPSMAAPTVYDGLEVVTAQPNWRDGIAFTNEHQFDTVDGDTGPIEWLQTEEYSRLTRAYGWLFENRADQYQFRGFLGRMRGCLKTCWMPTFNQDFVVNRTIGAADTSIGVVVNDYRTLVGDDTTRDRIMIKLRNGAVYFRKILGLSSDANGDILLIDSSLGVVVQPADVLNVHIMLRSRLASDKVTIEWRTPQVAEVTLSFKSVPA